MPEFPPPSFDVLTLAAVVHEVQAHLGARFAGVRQPAPDTVVLTLRAADPPPPPLPAGRHLLCCIHPQRARVHFAPGPLTTDRLEPFALLLRSRLTEARLRAAEQPAFDRVVRLRFETLEGPLDLIAEIMGRHSNLILAGPRGVLGALKVVSQRMSPRRPVIPGRPYLVPPADRPGPETVDEDQLHGLLIGDRPVWQQLSGGLRGLGPVLAREVAVWAGVDPAAPAREATRAAGPLLAAVQAIAGVARTGAFEPTVYESEGRVAAFAAIPLRVYESLAARPAASMSEAVSLFYRDRGEGDPLEARRRPLAAAVQTVLRQRTQALERSREALAESAGADRLRVMGDLLLAYGSRIRPGDTSVTLPDFSTGNAEITIPLDPALTASENAQRLFHRYRKARATARTLPARIAQLEAVVWALREAIVQVETAGSTGDLGEIHADLAARGTLRRAARSRQAPPAGSRGAPKGRRFRTAGGATIVAGRSARENDQITFHVAGPDDLWFHARGQAGAHVVLKTDGAPQDADITAAAQVAAFYSEGRHADQTAVDYVPRKHVRKMRGAPPGAVVYAGERTARVRPALPDPVARRDGTTARRRSP